MRQAEYDHLIPLELGGDPNDPRNLWVEPPSPGHKPSQGFRNPKDPIERKAKLLVCKGRVPLGVIAVNWVTALVAVGHPSGSCSRPTRWRQTLDCGATWQEDLML